MGKFDQPGRSVPCVVQDVDGDIVGQHRPKRLEHVAGQAHLAQEANPVVGAR